jgi:hypothetical protein
MWKRFRGAIAAAWRLYRHGAALKTLLQSLGVWQWLVLGLTIVMSATGAWLSHLSPILRALLALAGFAVLILTVGFAIALYRAYKEPELSGISVLSLLSVIVTGPAAWLPDRENLRGQYILRPVFRSDYDKPVSVRAIHWQPHDPASAAKTNMLTHGLQVQKPEGGWRREGGFETLIVNPHQAFCATIEAVGSVKSADLESLRDARQLGTITILVEGKEAAFVL